jgi:hypothetical protein
MRAIYILSQVCHDSYGATDHQYSKVILTSSPGIEFWKLSSMTMVDSSVHLLALFFVVLSIFRKLVNLDKF